MLVGCLEELDFEETYHDHSSRKEKLLSTLMCLLSINGVEQLASAEICFFKQLIMKILKVLGITLVFVILLGLTSGLYLNFALPNVGVAPELKVKKTTQTVERGRYLANHVTVCMDCHSTRDWNAFGGPIVPGSEGRGGEHFDKKAGFPGNIYSTNLTPYKLSSWTDGEIYRAITSGVGKDGHALFPVMGYQRFGKMSKDDVFSIIAYLRTLKPIKNDTPAPDLDFPVNLLNKLGPKKPEHSDMPALSDTVHYGGYLVNAAGCVDCHSKQEKGVIVAGSEFGGGMEFILPAGVIRAPNITMDRATGIGNWTKDMFVRRFKTHTNSESKPAKLSAGQLNSPMPWTMYGGMTEIDLGAIFAYLKTLKNQNNKVTVMSYAK